MSFTTKLFHYISGELQVVVKEFERLEDAIEHGIAAAAHAYKVFDHEGNICHDSHGHHRHHGHHPYC